MEPRQEHLIYEFGEFQLDALRRVLLSRPDGRPLPITGKVFDTLLYLVERAGQLLDKRLLMQALWPGIVVEESNLTQTIHTLRRVLGERPEEHRFIVTVPGRGYRFVADVRVGTVVEPAPVAAKETAKETVIADNMSTHGPKRLALVTLALAVLGGLLFLFLERPGGPPEASVAPSIAVLPFVDMSPERNQEYFADGLSEEILNLLAHSTSLRVIARTSSFSFRNPNNDIATIARRLNVTHVLEGSVRKSGDRIRITAQLVDGTTSAHVWSETYDREVKDVLGVQADIAAAVAESLQITLTGTDPPRRRETDSTEAFEHYLAGRYFMNRRGADDVSKAADYLKQALQLDPGYARAWAGLAGTYHVLTWANPIPDSTLRQWREAVDQALALGPNLAESHVRAAQYYWYLGDTTTADQHCKRAIALNPSDAMVLSVSAGKAVLEGHLSDAVLLQRSAVTVDPLSAANRANLGIYLSAAGNLDEAKAELEKAGELSPTLVNVHADIAKVLIIQRRFDEALVAAKKLPEGQLREHSLALVYQALGDAAAADATLARLLALATQPDADMLAKVAVAEVYTFRGNPDEAFKWLALASQQTREDRGHMQELQMTQEVNVSPFFNRLHVDPRWQSVLASVDVM